MAKRQIRFTKPAQFSSDLKAYINQKATIVKTDRTAIFVTILNCGEKELVIGSPYGRKSRLSFQDVEEIILDIR